MLILKINKDNDHIYIILCDAKAYKKVHSTRGYLVCLFVYFHPGYELEHSKLKVLKTKNIKWHKENNFFEILMCWNAR